VERTGRKVCLGHIVYIKYNSNLAHESCE